MFGNLFGTKELGHFTEIEVDGLKVDYVIRRKKTLPGDKIHLRVLLANDDAVFNVYGVDHSPFVSAVCIGCGSTASSEIAIMLSNAGKKKLTLAELQILVDYEMMRWTFDCKAKANCQPASEGYDPNLPDIYSVYEASTKTRKLQLIAEHGRVARRAFLKNEKSLLNIPRAAYKQAAKCRKLQEKAMKEQQTDDTEVVDLAGACS